MKPPLPMASHSASNAKYSSRCPCHGVPASIVRLLKNGETGMSTNGNAKMLDYVRTLRGWLSLVPEQNEREQFRQFLDLVDDGRHEIAMRLFDEEAARRAARLNEWRNGGEWI